jgi:SagB-type dehydrogenase family enzyme
MTRFLPHLVPSLESAGRNDATEHLFNYHQATKHTFASVRMGTHFLDWKNQPNPFRTYDGAPTISLPPDPGFTSTGTFTAIAELAGGDALHDGDKSHLPQSTPLDALWLSRLLWHSMAISAWKKVSATGSRYSLRVNPSSGNLHPTETYLALHGFADLDDGLYHYRADLHALEQRSTGNWPRELAQALEIPGDLEPSLIVALTSIFWREAWKYRDRAYRYCCHDLGHAAMSVLLAAGALGLPGGTIAHFADGLLAKKLGLAGSDEAPLAFLVFPSSTPVAAQSATPAQENAASEIFAGRPNELSTEEVRYEAMLDMHRATILPDPAGPPPSAAAIDRDSIRNTPESVPRAPDSIPAARNSIPTTLNSISVQEPATAAVGRPADFLAHESSCAPARDAPLAAIARRRRSALDFDPQTALMERADLEQLLDFATRDWPADWRGNFPATAGRRAEGADLVTLYLYVHRVRDCEPGIYRWDKAAAGSAGDSSARASAKLEQLHRGNVQRVAAYLSLEQALAGNACFAISMIADLARAALRFGNRGYRYALFEAGAIGERLYLGAEALGWNATGIGAFYDDDVHRYLGFLAEGSEDSAALPQQVIYHFAVGRAVRDPRLEG